MKNSQFVYNRMHDVYIEKNYWTSTHLHYHYHLALKKQKKNSFKGCASRGAYGT